MSGGKTWYQSYLLNNTSFHFSECLINHSLHPPISSYTLISSPNNSPNTDTLYQPKVVATGQPIIPTGIDSLL